MPVARQLCFARCLVAGCLALVASQLHAEPASYAAEADVFAREMVERHGFDSADLEGVLANARYSQAIVDAMNRPYEAKPWRDYRALFVTPARIAGGVTFWSENADLLARVEADYGVAPQIIVAIIGVETNYGANVGKHRVIDALTTLGFSYPRRATFFRRELEAFLVLSREEQLDPLGAVGSYAGAMGKPQFISSSYRNYAIDFDGDGRRDLWGSNADVVGSVANYFKQHGWRPGEPVAFAAELRSGVPAGITVVEKSPALPDTTAGDLRAAGVAWDETLSADVPASLIRLDGVEDEYWVGLSNFYAITRYNHSNLYAMAVYQLSEEIRENRSKATSSGTAADPSAADAHESAENDSD
ncbi:lytic murein transglycosylase B [Thiocapsa rosea]|uniref:Membrane-bound lytic murein transglycosylase B n=1 Tax=Thiocapsa rosea TaxID=69360 RepID=A0A495V5P0_9GAMM|nr:lytic murein transglycosylase B [Thiocapsa rosea]RKT44010.1 membrane-bound lytic murein transglycosylase B [Thiocapsa rosea]